jgi:hypothetical protein
MCPTANGPAGHQLEKSPNGPPAIEITAPEDAPDAGLRSLDHCTFISHLLQSLKSISAHLLLMSSVAPLVMTSRATSTPENKHSLVTAIVISD